MEDLIKIENLEVFCNHGVFPEETKLGQKFLVSCAMHLDTRRAGLSDDLRTSVHYGEVSHLIKRQMEDDTYLLIESVAEHLAETILNYDDLIKAVDIEVKKPWAPIGLPLESVSVSIYRKWHKVYIAFGSNMGDKEKFVYDAIKDIKETRLCRLKKISSLIQTKPYGGVEQDDFLNGVIEVETLLTARELLERLHEIEQAAGRERKIHWGPRTLDLDILLYDDDIIEDVDLCVPHIDMHNRKFVLEPMAEIAPYKRHPVYGKTMKEMLEELKK